MRGGKPISATTLPKMLQQHGIAAVAHGFSIGRRSKTDDPREVIDAALAHVVPNEVEAAHARSDLFERRRRLMANWADYLDGQPAMVAPLRRSQILASGEFAR